MAGAPPPVLGDSAEAAVTAEAGNQGERVVQICAETGRTLRDGEGREAEGRVTVRSGAFSSAGGRSYQEDAFVAASGTEAFPTAGGPHPPDGERAFFGVFDGHGGTDCALHARDTLMGNVAASARFPDDLRSAVAEAYRKTDVAFGALCDAGEREASGATALCVAFWGGTRYAVANAGDCRAVLCRRGKAVDLTSDHKPDNPCESARIKACGGFVEDGYLNGVLGCTRALGDWDLPGLKPWPPAGHPPAEPAHAQADAAVDAAAPAAPAPAPEAAAAAAAATATAATAEATAAAGDGRKEDGPLISDPDVVVRNVDLDEDEFLVLACDGLWDVFSSQSCTEFTRHRLRAHNDAALAAQELVEEAVERRHATDNVTVIVVCFGPGAPPRREYVRMTDDGGEEGSRGGGGEEDGGGEGGGLHRSASGRIKYSMSQGALAALSSALKDC